MRVSCLALLTSLLISLGSVCAEEFLETDYQPIAKWLDERFEVEFKEVPLELIFEQVPLNDIFYELKLEPKKRDPLSLGRMTISRRGLLELIASAYDLEMFFKLNDQSEPTALVVGDRLN